MQVWNFHTWPFYLSMPILQNSQEEEICRHKEKGWQTQVMKGEKRFISSQAKSQGSSRGGQLEDGPFTWYNSLLIALASNQAKSHHSWCLPPPPLTANTVTGLIGVQKLLSFREVIFSNASILSQTWKSFRIRGVLQKCLMNKTFTDFKIQT